MKPIPLQLVTVCLENGQQGVFVGVPLVEEQLPEELGQIEDIWFSDVQDVPASMDLQELITCCSLSFAAANKTFNKLPAAPQRNCSLRRASRRHCQSLFTPHTPGTACRRAILATYLCTIFHKHDFASKNSRQGL